MTQTDDASQPRLTTEDLISEEQRSQIIEEYESESQVRQLSGMWRTIAGVLAAGLAVYALYGTQFSITTQVYRATFLMVVLVLTFLFYPLLKRDRQRMGVSDIVLGVLSVISLGYLVQNYAAALDRVIFPTPTELAMGGLMILLVLEATRRTTGWVLPITAGLFLIYAYFGPSMPRPFDHRGYSLQRIIGQNYLTLEGVFGVPLDVAATFIILFTIYGAVLEYSGAGKFFLDWSFAALGRSRSGAGPGRTVTAAGFLLGTVSGSGVATTVTLGSLAWPMLKKAGYDRNVAGGILSAAGIGALLSPPTLGAAAFLIAEYLDVSYLQVLIYATVPTLLYYLSCLLMVEADSRRMQTRAVVIDTLPLWQLTARYGYHFSSLFVIVILLALGLTPFRAVFFAIVAAFALSFLRPETRLTSRRALAVGALVSVVLLAIALPQIMRTPAQLQPQLSIALFWGMMVTAAIAAGLVAYRRLGRAPRAAAGAGENAQGVASPGLTGQASEDEDSRLLLALEAGGKGALSVAATTACAGIIVSIVTLTGLGLKISGLIVQLSGGVPLLTVLFAALAIWVLGLAVPVTASYIIAAVMIIPALSGPRGIGVPEVAAHMFVFYYAVLADVSPPTALAPFAAAALTGGNPFKTTMFAWKYCLPAFLVPFMFTLSPQGAGLLLLGDNGSGGLSVLGDPLSIAWTCFTACIAVGALAIAFGGYLVKQANAVERVVAGLAGLALLYADPRSDAVGIVLLIVVAVMHLLRLRRAATLSGPTPANPG
ncbi:MAG: TRAP transporter fused permease subunit [Chloroflexi bacterium]|nr:TRAP transporter fused permease subunit [Chloroflexota bacterium]